MRRSLVYAPLWIAIAGAYVGIAAALGLAASGAGVQLAIVVTIVVTVLFEPARRHLSGGRRAGRTVSRSAARSSCADSARRSSTRSTSSSWCGDRRERTRGAWRAWTRIRVDGAEPVVDGEPPPRESRRCSRLSLFTAGSGSGEIECGARVRGRPQGSDQELLNTLARQAALAIHNARLAGELARRLDEIKAQAAELAASRSRIVSAQESARRQIERDIHDGAQQELAALIARIGLARNQLGRDSRRLGETLGDLKSEARQALENLRRVRFRDSSLGAVGPRARGGDRDPLGAAAAGRDDRVRPADARDAL